MLCSFCILQSAWRAWVLPLRRRPRCQWEALMPRGCPDSDQRLQASTSSAVISMFAVCSAQPLDILSAPPLQPRLSWSSSIRGVFDLRAGWMVLHRSVSGKTCPDTALWLDWYLLLLQVEPFSDSNERKQKEIGALHTGSIPKSWWELSRCPQVVPEFPSPHSPVQERLQDIISLLKMASRLCPRLAERGWGEDSSQRAENPQVFGSTLGDAGTASRANR